MKKLIVVFFLFAVLIKPAAAQQTFAISGTVTDEKGQAIPGATIFLTNTKDVTATDNTGKFMLSDLAPGPYEMVVNMLGFTPDIRLVKIENKNLGINITLKGAVINLNTVDIKEKPDRKRKKYIELFTECFIGKSTSASQCKLVNPDVLTFYYNEKSGTLYAYASDFLIIENHALGYRIKYLLKSFHCYSYSLCNYDGNPYFEELNGDEAQKKQWEYNRRVAYLGSSRHFFRAVMNNTAAAEGFAIYQYKGGKIVSPDFNSVFQDIDSTKTLVSKYPSPIKMQARDQFYIVYKRAKESDLFKKTGVPLIVFVDSSRFYQFSMIRVFADTIKVNKELLLNPFFINFSFSGYWAWERIAEYLPLDYFVDPLEAEKR